MRMALLSNVNMNGVIRYLKKEVEIYKSEGYGNEIGTLMNPSSSIYEYQPDFIFIVNDLMELVGHNLDLKQAEQQMRQWFNDLASCIRSEIIYYISDAYLFGMELEVNGKSGLKIGNEFCWQTLLEKFVQEKSNVRIFPYRKLVENLGENNSFSMKTWYMGKILHSASMQQVIAKEILNCTEVERSTPKKVLALDLDNTLWGGLAGENDITPINLSDDHSGLAYKNLQRVLHAMEMQGVILTIVSKNNEEDAIKIIKDHPHMVLRIDDFSATRINWENKADNLKSIAAELNLGLDSIVFFDDNATERQLIKDLLPEVVVPDFPETPEELANAMLDIWQRYFCKAVVTQEDKDKTKQYRENAQREAFKTERASFEDYLAGLNIVLCRKVEKEHSERILQLLNKTNQFNLMTKRHEAKEIQELMQNPKKKIFVYQAKDRFGDYGVIAVAIAGVALDCLTIEEFVMSCRTMGKNIENAIVDDIEGWAKNIGCSKVRGIYSQTQKNMPVKDLYPTLGYKTIKDSNPKEFEILIEERPERKYKLEKIVEGET